MYINALVGTHIRPDFPDFSVFEVCPEKSWLLHFVLIKSGQFLKVLYLFMALHKFCEDTGNWAVGTIGDMFSNCFQSHQFVDCLCCKWKQHELKYSLALLCLSVWATCVIPSNFSSSGQQIIHPLLKLVNVGSIFWRQQKHLVIIIIIVIIILLSAYS